MSLFGVKEIQEKRKKRLAEEAKQRLDVDSLSQENAQSVKYIIDTLSEYNMLEIDPLLSQGTDTHQKFTNYLLSAIIEQNCIMIRQLDEISRKLDK